MKFVITTSGLIRVLIYLLAFSITFYIIGFSLAGLKINLPLLLIFILDVMLIIRGKFISKDLLLIIIFSSLCFLSTLFRYPFLSYFPSLTLTMLLILPLAASWNKLDIDREKLMNFLVAGALISLFYIPFELYFRYMHLFGYKGNELWVSISGHSFCFYRASSTMLEPSHYTVVLLFIYILIDIAQKRGYSIRNSGLFRYCFFIALILGVSLSGIVLICLYLILKLIYFSLKFVTNKSKIVARKNKLIKILSGIVLLLVINGLSHDFSGKVISKIRERVSITTDVIARQKSEGSSGERLSFIWVSKMYVTQSPVSNILFGEGFSNYRQWLVNNKKQIGYDTGEAYNLFLIVFLSIGIIGLIAFIIMLLGISEVNFLVFDEIVFVTILFVSFFTHGYLVMYWMWTPILFFKIVKSNS
jgi:hypothetical protein